MFEQLSDEFARLLFKVREQCFFEDDYGGIGVSEDVVIPSELFSRICAALKELSDADYKRLQREAFQDILEVL